MIHTNIAKQIALVTGANQGIGFETARQLAQDGMSVILSGRRFKEVTAAADRLRSEGLSDVMAFKLDIKLAEDRLSVARYISDQFGRLDILVHNAGLATPEGTLMEPVISETSERELREVFDTNLFSVVLLTQALLHLLKKSESGRIVNVSSQLGSLTLHATRAERVAYNKRFAYNASKAALNMFTILLAQELQNTNIKVNSVHPGWVKTRTGGDAAPLEPAEGARRRAWQQHSSALMDRVAHSSSEMSRCLGKRIALLEEDAGRVGACDAERTSRCCGARVVEGTYHELGSELPAGNGGRVWGSICQQLCSCALDLAAPSTFAMRLRLYAIVAMAISPLAPVNPRTKRLGCPKMPYSSAWARRVSECEGAALKTPPTELLFARWRR